MGARVFKTGLAVTIASAICLYFDIPVIFAALSAVVNMKPSIIQSWENASEQVSVHILGVVVAFIIGLTFGTHPNPLTMGLAVVVVIILCARFGWHNGSLMGVLTALFILTASPEDFVPHAIIRTQSVFIGLIIATIINYFILPPRYGQQLRTVLQDLAEQVVSLFSDMVRRFVALDPMPIEQLTAQEESIKEKMNKTIDLLARYHEQIGRVKPRGNKPYNDPAFLEKYFYYLQGLFERSLALAEIIEQRLQRRASAGNQPLSEEFEQVLTLVSQGAVTVVNLNKLLRQVVFDNEQVRPETTTHHYWEELAQVIESWHGKFSGSYYLHALVEVGVVVSEIKWAAEKVRTLFADIQ